MTGAKSALFLKPAETQWASEVVDENKSSTNYLHHVGSSHVVELAFFFIFS